jgi:hypothetical protein
MGGCLNGIQDAKIQGFFPHQKYNIRSKLIIFEAQLLKYELFKSKCG